MGFSFSKRIVLINYEIGIYYRKSGKQVVMRDNHTCSIYFSSLNSYTELHSQLRFHLCHTAHYQNGAETTNVNK